MAEQKSKVVSQDIEAFIAEAPERKREDTRRLIALMRDWTGEEPDVWTHSGIGFGRYHYKYDSGHEGDAALVGFSPRKAAFSIYLMGSYSPEHLAAREALLARLGKHRMGKACLYVNKLADIDLTVLEELVRLSLAELRAAYPQG